MKKALLLVAALAVGLFIIAGCGAGDKCDEYIDLLCEKCGDSSDLCKAAEEASDAAGDDVECDEDAAQENIDKVEGMSEDDIDAFCNPGV